MKRFYFTNPTDDRVKAKEIQLQIEKAFKDNDVSVELINPFYDRGGNPTPEIRALDKGERPKVSANEIVDTDLRLIDESDGIIAYITRRTSWGSIQESYHSARVARKPTYLIFDPNSRGKCPQCKGSNPNNPTHPWVVRNSTRVFGSIDAFINFAKERLCETPNGSQK